MIRMNGGLSRKSPPIDFWLCYVGNMQRVPTLKVDNRLLPQEIGITRRWQISQDLIAFIHSLIQRKTSTLQLRSPRSLPTLLNISTNGWGLASLRGEVREQRISWRWKDESTPPKKSPTAEQDPPHAFIQFQKGIPHGHFLLVHQPVSLVRRRNNH